jgi:hypothetical protein
MGSNVRSNKMGLVLKGLKQYYKKQEISADSRQAILDLYCQTNGKFTDRLARALRLARLPRRGLPISGCLGEFSTEKQTEIALSIRENGYYVFEQRIPEEICDLIENFAKATPAIVDGRGADKESRVVFDPMSPLSKKYYFPEGELVGNAGMQQLMGDPVFLAIAERYLGTLPLLSDTTLWWSGVHAGIKDFDAGQQYHFDFDTPPGWLMIFVYLTDVDANNGPHLYVRGSHRSGVPQARELRSRGYVRIGDDEVRSIFGQDSVIELTGKRGTVLAVDTLGFHKGKALVSGHRLMGQLIYSFAHFAGAHKKSLPLVDSIHPVLSGALNANPRVYEKYR